MVIDEFLSFVKSLEAQAVGREVTVRGYKVKTSFRTAEEEKEQLKKKALSQVILDSLKKMRK